MNYFQSLLINIMEKTTKILNSDKSTLFLYDKKTDELWSSVIQDTEIAFSPAGVGVTLAVGEILDPINDLIERFSFVMLVSTASLGIQKILLEVGIWFGFRLLLTFSMLLIVPIL